MKCSEISSLLVDSLYEEMPAEQRREFLAHVDGCASCSAEVKAMSSTLGHARAALRGPLAEDPPARVRARVLEAARAAVNAKAAERLKPRTSRAPQAEGFFARLWKTPWLVPALGAAGVATAVFLVKVIKNPQVIPEPKPAVTEAFTPPTAEPKESRQARPQPEAEGAPTATAPAEQGLAGLTKRPTAGMERESQAESKRASTADKLRTAPPTRSSPATSRRQPSNDLLAGVQWEAQPRTPVGEATASKGGGKASTPSRAAADAIAKPESAPALRADKDEASLDEPLRPLPQGRKTPVAEGAGSSGRWAQPPPPRAAEAPLAAAPTPVAAAEAPAATKPAPVEKAAAIADLEDRAGNSVAKESTRSATPAKTLAPVRAASAGPAAQAETPADKKKVHASKETISFEERVRKAEKLFAEKKWAEAAAAFRALLAQAPSNPAAKTWRERVAAAESAQEQDRTLKAKTKTSNDALDGL
ncbi:MAG: zf-HC2 domain-containing protein [Polyangia bacterium]|jgi:hypothetical protein